jgi:hypothetical protein
MELMEMNLKEKNYRSRRLHPSRLVSGRDFEWCRKAEVEPSSVG